jgi:hypothetical protein
MSEAFDPSSLTWDDVMENRRKWIARLREPESEQITGHLANYDNPRQACVLGHGCEAVGVPRYLGEDFKTKPESGLEYGYDLAAYGKLKRVAAAPDEIYLAVGLAGGDVWKSSEDEEDEYEDEDDIQDAGVILFGMNDNGPDQMSLQEMADLLELDIEGREGRFFMDKATWERRRNV